MHKNSFEALKSGISTGSFKRREQAIFNLLYFGKKEMTVSEILSQLYPNSDNKNLVAPRLTEMTAAGSLREVGDRQEHGKTVTVYGVCWPVVEKQVSLF